MVSMVIIMFLIGVLILLFAGRLAEVLMARAKLRDRGRAPVMAVRRLHEDHGRPAVEKAGSSTNRRSVAGAVGTT